MGIMPKACEALRVRRTDRFNDERHVRLANFTVRTSLSLL